VCVLVVCFCFFLGGCGVWFVVLCVGCVVGFGVFVLGCTFFVCGWVFCVVLGEGLALWCCVVLVFGGGRGVVVFVFVGGLAVFVVLCHCCFLLLCLVFGCFGYFFPLTCPCRRSLCDVSWSAGLVHVSGLELGPAGHGWTLLFARRSLCGVAPCRSGACAGSAMCDSLAGGGVRDRSLCDLRELLGGVRPAGGPGGRPGVLSVSAGRVVPCEAPGWSEVASVFGFCCGILLVGRAAAGPLVWGSWCVRGGVPRG